MVDSGTVTGSSDLSADHDSDLSSNSPTSFSSSGFGNVNGMQATSTPVGRRDENGPRRLSANALEFAPRSLPNSEARSESGESGPTDWFGLSAPKFGTMIPNRIFVGGISSTTTENDLCDIFARYGRVSQSKIIMDRSGVSKGYGFITFETEAEAKALCDKIAAKELEPIMFRERRLTVAPAVKKQVVPQPTAAPTFEIAMHHAQHPPIGYPTGQPYYYYCVPQPMQQVQVLQHQIQPQHGGYFHSGAGDHGGATGIQYDPASLYQQMALPHGYGGVGFPGTVQQATVAPSYQPQQAYYYPTMAPTAAPAPQPQIALQPQYGYFETGPTSFASQHGYGHDLFQM